MLWATGDGMHRGVAAIVIADGRSAQTIQGGVLRVDDGTTLPASDTQWQARCSCGWAAPLMFERGADSDNLAPHQVYEPEGGPAPDGVEESCNTEWLDHVRPHVGIPAVRQAVEDRRAADARLDYAVAAARACGSSWAEIGDAVGMSRQSAHERWRRIEPGEQSQPEEGAQ